MLLFKFKILKISIERRVNLPSWNGIRRKKETGKMRLSKWLVTKLDPYSSYYARILAYIAKNRLVVATLAAGANESLKPSRPIKKKKKVFNL